MQRRRRAVRRHATPERCAEDGACADGLPREPAAEGASDHRSALHRIGGDPGLGTGEAMDEETFDKESRVSRPADGRSWATHPAPKQEGMRQGLAPQEDIPYPMPPP